MFGAILGDIIGSTHEFDEVTKSKEFTLFGRCNIFTDDTVMTVAIAEALMDAGIEADIPTIEEHCVRSMQKWGNRYRDAGYGSRFRAWLSMGKDAHPYNSWGNGSAMRVSPAGWLYDSMERTREVARATANVTHNHPEGLKGAEATAAAIYLARNGKTKAEIKQYVETEFGYDLDRAPDSIRPDFRMYEDCGRTVPEAIVCFLYGKDFEDTVRNAVSLGGDTDTLAAIAGSVAEAFFGLPQRIAQQGAARLTKEMLLVVERFYNTIRRSI